MIDDECKTIPLLLKELEMHKDHSEMIVMFVDTLNGDSLINGAKLRPEARTPTQILRERLPPGGIHGAGPCRSAQLSQSSSDAPARRSGIG